MSKSEAASKERRLTSQFPLEPAVDAETMLNQMRSSLGRGLKEARPCKRHDLLLSICGGGPSLGETYKEIEKGSIVAGINGSLWFLFDRGVPVHMCGVLDPREHIADIITALPNAGRYYVASMCHPKVFDKLEGCDVTMWHASGTPGAEDVLKERGGDYWLIGGGSTMGLRWINLGYFLGFRKFHLHGFDSSFREGNTHAYSDYRDGQWASSTGKYATRPEFMQQVADFFVMLERFSQADIEPIEIEVFGNGLLPDAWKNYRAANPTAFKKGEQ